MRVSNAIIGALLEPNSFAKYMFNIVYDCAGFVSAIDFIFVTTRFCASTTTRNDWFSLTWPIIHLALLTYEDKSAVYRYVGDKSCFNARNSNILLLIKRKTDTIFF